MVRDGVAVDSRLAGAVARFAAGERINVAAVCVELGVSRQTFYKYARRFQAEGVAGLFARSRRPGSSPGAVPPAMEDAVVLARKRLVEQGLDGGATSIGWWLQDHPEVGRGLDGAAPVVPSRATINRVLGRRGLLVTCPQRRPKRGAWRRFVRAARNDLWQMDGFVHRLAGGETVMVIEIIDDHSRVLVASHAASSENNHDVWAAFTTAAHGYGLPRQLLTDNGTAFNGHRRGWATPLETAAAALGIEALSSTVGHPQTCGKIERVHSTSRRWLARQPTAATLTELADQLTAYRTTYNNRRHQALDGLTPNQAWALAPASGPHGTPLPGRLTVTTRPVCTSGCIQLDTVTIGVGRKHHHATATAFRNDDHVTIFIGGQLIRELTIDRTRRYQPHQLMSAKS